MRISDWSSDVCSSDLLPSKPKDVSGVDRIAHRVKVIDVTHEKAIEWCIGSGGFQHRGHAPGQGDELLRRSLREGDALDRGDVGILVQDRKSTRLNSSH